jgi:DNA-binding XRE family transcriptional regulator
MIDPETITDARRALGRQLAALRNAAGLNQHKLAQRIHFGRSTIANAETGYSTCSRAFWEQCDTILDADQALIQGYEELQALTRQQHRDVAQLMETKRDGTYRQIQDKRLTVDVDAAARELPDKPDEAPQDAADRDLVEFALVLGRRGISDGALTAAELTCERLDQQFARRGPDDVLWQVRLLMRAILTQLREAQSLGHQQRLLTLAGRLAGLRAWACFDIDEHREAERWYDLAVTAALEAEAWSLAAWLLGAQSLIPWHQRDRRRTVELIEQGIHVAGRGADSTTRAWMHALEARGRASMGDRHGFDAAYAKAQESAEDSSEHDRRHGMDFDQGVLDLRYYAGTSLLQLRQPNQAEPALKGSLAALPDSHTKARAVLTLALADAAMQSDNLDQAIDLTRQALAATRHQPIMPILQQARRIQRLIQHRNPAAAVELHDEVHDFAHALTDVASRAEQ